jgi:hypothetical protein
MPYDLVKAPKNMGYFVETKGTHRRHSKKPLPRKNAVAQMRALYANVKDSAK